MIPDKKPIKAKAVSNGIRKGMIVRNKVSGKMVKVEDVIFDKCLNAFFVKFKDYDEIGIRDGKIPYTFEYLGTHLFTKDLRIITH